MKTALFPIACLWASFAIHSSDAQTVSGVSHTRVHEQTGPEQTVPFGFYFQSYVEGDGLSANSPFSSVTVQATSVSKSLAFEDGRWNFEEDLIGVSQAQYSGTYPDGNYTMSAGGEAVTVSLSSSYPNQPVMTFNHDNWQGGELVLTAEQAKSDCSLATNQSDGDGFVTLEIVDLDTDEDIVDIVRNTGGQTGGAISHNIQGNTLKPGHRYEVYAEFDQVVDFNFNGLDGGTTFAVASAGTKITIRVQNEVLDADLVWTCRSRAGSISRRKPASPTR